MHHQVSQAAKNKMSRNAWRPARPWSISCKRTSMALFATLLLATLASSTGNYTMVLFYFSPYISCISHGIQFRPSPPSPLLLPSSLYPTNHHIRWTRAKSDPSKHLSPLNISLAHPFHMLQTRASASEPSGSHSLLLRLVSSVLPCSSHSLSLSSLVVIVISLLFILMIHTGIVPRSWSSWK